MKKFATEKIVIDIEKVMPNFWNPNHMPKAMFEKMKQTISEKGLFGSIYCRKYGDKYQILDGEHRMKACKELGFTTLPVECAVNEMTDNEVQFWTIYFNNTRGKDDIEKRSKILENIEKGQAQLLPFTDEEIENEKNLFKFDFSQYHTIDPGVSPDEMVNVLTFKFNEAEYREVQDALAFAKVKGLTPKQWFMIQLGRFLDYEKFRVSNPQDIELIKP